VAAALVALAVFFAANHKRFDGGVRAPGALPTVYQRLEAE
jgi:hypothetical protein